MTTTTEPAIVPSDRLLVSLPEAAAILGVGRRLIDDGSLPSFKIGGRRVLRRRDIEAFVHGMEEPTQQT